MSGNADAAAAERSRLWVAIRHGIPLDRPWRGEALDLIFDAVQPGALALAAGPSATCTFITDDGEGNGEWCGKPSRFVVSRSDGDTSYGAGGGTEETCEGHLADSVTGMVAGDVNVQAIVTVRWDEPETPAPGKGSANG